MFYEYVGNLHMHSGYSDGHASHDEIAVAAIHAGLDFVVVTDHNVWVDGMDGYRYRDDQRVLLVTGEEIHDPLRVPQKNHLLVYEVNQELAPFADGPQDLIERVNKLGGLSFIAHPLDPAAPAFDEDDLSWVDWDVEGFTGIELWNYMSEFKSHLSSLLRAFYFAYLPHRSGRAPFEQVLERWDSLLAAGRRVVAIGGSDAHGMPVRKGPFRRVILPYEFLFRAVNTHVLTKEPLLGDAESDRRRLFHAIKNGRCFTANGLPANPRGFRYTAQGDGELATMGDTLRAEYGVTLQVKLPEKAHVTLIRHGERVQEWRDCENAVHTVTRPGAYRVEAHLPYAGELRGWVYSNPIYVRD